MDGIHVLPSATKHGLSEEEVAYAWANPLEYRRAKGNMQPPHYLALGSLPNGQTAEMVGFSTGLEWYVFHAMTPPRAGFLHEWKGASK